MRTTRLLYDAEQQAEGNPCDEAASSGVGGALTQCEVACDQR